MYGNNTISQLSSLEGKHQPEGEVSLICVEERKPQNITINRGYKTHRPVSETPADIATSGTEWYPKPGGRPLLHREDGYTIAISFHSICLRLVGIIDWGHASFAKQLWHGRQPIRKWPQQGRRQILQVFPTSRDISAAL